jgi:hypothetical protein
MSVGWRAALTHALRLNSINRLLIFVSRLAILTEREQIKNILSRKIKVKRGL